MESSTLVSPTPDTAAVVTAKRPKAGRGGFLRYLVQNRRWIALLALAVIAVFLVAAVAAPLFFDWTSVTRVNLADALIAPNSTYWLGTDDLGRNLLGRVVWGSRITLSVARNRIRVGA